MKSLIEKSLRSLVALILVVALQLPVAAKISHAFIDHIEIECNDYGSLHIHEVEFDCEFQKYNFSTEGMISDYPTGDLELAVVSEQIFRYYSFLYKSQKLHFSLRGPPVFS